jgi:hypothetical protein
MRYLFAPTRLDTCSTTEGSEVALRALSFFGVSTERTLPEHQAALRAA